LYSSSKIIYINGKIYTVDEKQPWAEAMVICDEKFIFVGSNEEAKKYYGSNAEIIDLEGKFVLPGFVEGHCHPAYSAINSNGVNISECNTVEQYFEEISLYIKGNPGIEVIRGYGWDVSLLEHQKFDRVILDKITENIPIVITEKAGHQYWVNTRVLILANVNSDTNSLISEGHFCEDENGDLTGIVQGLEAMSFIDKAIPSLTVNDYENAIVKFISEANKAGITTIHDASLGYDKMFDAYINLANNEKLNAKIRLAAAINSESEGGKWDEQIEKFLKIRNACNIKNILKLTTIKFFIDGMLDDYTALLEEPYADKPETKGEASFDIERLKEIFALADKYGFQIHTHAIGDRAVRYTIDACEYAEKINGKRDSRHKPGHLGIVNDKDFDRMKDLGMIPVFTTFWIEREDYHNKIERVRLGEERADKAYPIKSCIDKGIKVACGSDAPIVITKKPVEVQFSPIMAIQQGITRCHPMRDYNDTNYILGPSERLTLEEMIRTYTIDSAYAIFMEDIVGTIEEGKHADLIIIDRNMFELDKGEIYKAQILETIFKGKTVYKRDIDL